MWRVYFHLRRRKGGKACLPIANAVNRARAEKNNLTSNKKLHRRPRTAESCGANCEPRDISNRGGSILQTQEPKLNDLEEDVIAHHARPWLDVVPTILEVVCRTTGLGFSAVARVTADRWVACAVRDEIGFGLKPGGELEVETTICDEIRDSGQLVVIDHVAEDDAFCDHPTPQMYGFQSYISVPIAAGRPVLRHAVRASIPAGARQHARDDRDVPAVRDLIALHLEGEHGWGDTETALTTSGSAPACSEQFVAVLGHDLRNPLSAIQVALGRCWRWRTPRR